MNERERLIRSLISDEAVEAWRAADYGRLHRALGLRPWDCSPLWVDPGGSTESLTTAATMGEMTAPFAREIARVLWALAGPPGEPGDAGDT